MISPVRFLLEENELKKLNLLYYIWVEGIIEAGAAMLWAVLWG